MCHLEKHPQFLFLSLHIMFLAQHQSYNIVLKTFIATQNFRQ
jgi:hypothetical protein